MYNFVIRNITNKYDFTELIKIFLSPDDFSAYTQEEFENISQAEKASGQTVYFNDILSEDKNLIKREIYSFLSSETGKTPPWGILTGVRPVKLTGEIFERTGIEKSVFHELLDTYLLSREKAELLINTYKYQQKVCGKAEPSSVGVYIGIPFCPTRCLYCSFTSNQVPDNEIARYLEALKKEIEYTGRRMRETGLWPESIYIGGGTPTTLTAGQLDRLLTAVEDNMDLSRTVEFTVEAGRPDTITLEKLKVIKKHGVQRISINPQSMKERTLELIGRSHSPDDIVKAFEKSASAGISAVNADVIAGLPEEEPEDFAETLKRILELDPENITVHTLAVKRASRLVEMDRDYHYRQSERVKKML